MRDIVPPQLMEKKASSYYIGTCPYRHAENVTDRLHTEMPDPDVLEEVMCGPYNRKGLLCGECVDGHGPVLYQLYTKCVKCGKHSLVYAILLYTALELVPITLVFLCMTIFHLDLTSGPLFGYFIFWQLEAIVISKYVFVFQYALSHMSPLHRALLNAWVMFGQFMSINFLVVPFCISENLTGIHIQMLHLISAIYPLFLVFITCVLMELYARNYRIIHTLWKPFGIILRKTNITEVTSDAVIHSFASFILLSYLTVYNTMANVLTGTLVKRILVVEIFYVLYFDPTIEWLSQEHVQYIIIAAVPFIVVTLIPSLLLTIYPTRLYSRYLSRFISARKRLAITAFTEALHKCFKDGLNGTTDCRVFPGVMLVVPVLYVLFKNILGEFDPDSSIAAVFFLLFITCIVSYLKPCKSGIANFSLSFHMFLLTLLCTVYHLWQYALYVATKWFLAAFTIILVMSHILMLTWAGYMIIRRILRYFRYQFNPSRCSMALADLANGVKQQFHRRRRGYLALN